MTGPGRRRLRLGPAGWAGLIILGGLLTLAVFAPLLSPYDPHARVGAPFGRPTVEHLLGTDDVGHDLLSELIHGARVSLAVGVAAAAAATALGAAIGLSAGYARGWLDALLMRVVDVILSLPFVPLALVVGVFLGPGLVTIVALIAVVHSGELARELRSQVLSIRELDHVAASRAMGAGALHVLGRHVLVDVSPLLVAQFVRAAKIAIVAEASLSFLGLGDPTTRSWGATLSYAHERSAFLTDAWLWWVVPPGLCIAATVLAFALVGRGLEEASRPRLRRRSQSAPRAVATTGSPRRETPPLPGPRPVLEVVGLSVLYDSPGGPVVAVDDVSITVMPGEVVGLIGESGSGKSTLVMAAAALLKPPAAITGGQVRLAGEDLATLSPVELRRRRGTGIALVPQQAMTALDPVMRVGDQIAEAIRAHQTVPRSAARARARQLLGLVGLDPDRAGDYPHQFSGGMRQRVVIAMALANDPALLIADEPTTGLDLVTAASLVDLLAELQQRLGMAMLVVSHDLAAVLGLASRVVVLEGGKVVEEGASVDVAGGPSHPHTRALVDAVPRLRPELVCT
jgi:peptide/nickel transport system ATP-binding protein